MPLHVVLSNRSGVPIYQQIVDQARAAILKDELAEGELLPSIRGLARDLRISVITTTRAYNELAQLGYIVNVPGKGSYAEAWNVVVPPDDPIRSSPYDIIEPLRRRGFQMIEAPSIEEVKHGMAVNLVAIAPGLVVMPDGNPETKKALEKAGVEVIPVDVSELMKGYGCLHCMTAFLEREEL